MRISDWSSDVCSSDLRPINPIFSMLTAPLFVYKADRESIPHVGRFRTSVEIDSILALLALAVAGTFDAPKRHVVVKARRRQIDHSPAARSEEHTSELQSLMRISYAVFCLKKTN